MEKIYNDLLNNSMTLYTLNNFKNPTVSCFFVFLNEFKLYLNL